MPLPQELLDRLTRQFGASQVESILRAFKADRLPTLRTNTLKATDDSVMAFFREAAIQFERVKSIPHAFLIKNRTSQQLLESPLAQTGHIYLQGLTSMLPPLILDPQSNEQLLDLCAAPGSKTSQLAALMQEASSPPYEGGARGGIIACELDQVRAQKLRHTLTLQGVTNTDVIEGDASLTLRDRLNTFDKILADVPCSAEGRIDTHNARSYSFWSQKNIIAHAKLQRRLLRSAVPLLKPGGVLVYSTCTLAPEENEDMMTWLLTEFPDLREEPITPFNGSREANHGLIMLPSDKHEGFYVCKIRKT